MDAVELGRIIERLPATEDARVLSQRRDRPILLHEHHRWTLPIIVALQEYKLLPQPCVLVAFDAHDDGVPPRYPDRLAGYTSPITSDDAFRLCEEGLSTMNDDWIKAGMELGAIAHAVVFGARAEGRESAPEHRDRDGQVHHLLTCPLPSSSLGYQGRLVDRARRAELQPLWDILCWEPHGNDFRFRPGAPAIFLSIDLDCFVEPQLELLLPWHPKLWQREFIRESHYRPGWSGQRLFRELLNRSAAVDLVREPACCGSIEAEGQEHADIVLRDVDTYLFAGALGVSSRQPY